MRVRNAAVSAAEGAGYSRIKTVNEWEVYRSSAGCEVKIPLTYKLTDAQYDAIIAAIESPRRTSSAKRKKSAASRRHEAEERKREMERQAIAAESLRRDESVFGTLGPELTGREKRDIRRLWEEEEAERYAIAQLMTEIPTPNAHAGRLRAQHRS